MRWKRDLTHESEKKHSREASERARGGVGGGEQQCTE